MDLHQETGNVLYMYQNKIFQEVSNIKESVFIHLEQFLNLSFHNIKANNLKFINSKCNSILNLFDQENSRIRLPNTNISPIYIANIKSNIEYIEYINKLSQYSLFTKDTFHNYFKKIEDITKDKKQQINQEINTELSDLEFINQSFNIIVIFFNNVTIFQYKIVKILKRLIKLIFNGQKKNIYANSLDSYLIDQNLHPIICLNPNSNQETKGDNKFMSQISFITEKYKNLFDDIIQFKDKSENDIEIFLKNHIYGFYEKLLQIFSNNAPIEKIEKDLNEIYKKFSISKRTKIKPSLDHPNPDSSFKDILSIANSHIPQNFKMIQKTLNSLFDMCDSRSKDFMQKSAYLEVQDIFKYDFKFEIDSGDNLIEKIQQNGKYFYFDIIFQVFLKTINISIIPPYKFGLQLNELIQIDLDSAKMNYFSSNISTYKLFVDDNSEFFYLQKEFIGQIDEEQVEREKNILSANYSKFIVHIVKTESKNKYYIPYFPNGTLKSLFYKENSKTKKEKNNTELTDTDKIKDKIKLTKVDKIVIILEICQAIKDLHSKQLYHGNISNLSIYINSSKDAYVGNLYNNSINPTIKKDVYYRDQRTIDDNEIQKNDSTYKLMDIFSFGVLLFEIVTEISPDMLLTILNGTKREEILKGSYCKYLLTGCKRYDESSIDIRGDSMNGMKNIIEKCMNDIGSRYSNFDEIEQSIKALAIYEQNKEEIEYRIETAVPSSEYRCSLNDFVESYYRGQEMCKDNIEDFLNTLPKPKEKEKTTSIISKIVLYFSTNYSDRLMQQIDTTDYNWYNLLEFARKKSKKNSKVIEEISSIFKFYEEFTGKSVKKDFFLDFLTEIGESKTNQNISMVKPTINKLLEQGKYYCFNVIFHCVFKRIINIEKIKEKFREALLKSNKNLDKIFEIQEILRFNEINSSCKVLFDQFMHFYIKKTYNSNVREKIREREKNILKSKYSKFIVNLIENENKNENEDNDSIVFPYYPIGMLENLLISENGIKFSLTDKIVIILELATAMNDLHSNNEYHGNLSSQSVLIDSRKDAYLAGFSYDINVESDATKPRGPFYYRAAKKIKELNLKNSIKGNNNNDEVNDTDEKIKEEQSNDIYSFGVLMHEIMTETNPEKRMSGQNLPRQKRVTALTENYFEYLFSDDYNNKVFKNDSIKELKDIIEKCMKQDSDERFSSFKELIQSIKNLPIYKNNEEEIGYRIDHATVSYKYKCTLTDIVESYYQGQFQNKEDINEVLSIYERIKCQDNEKNVVITGDIIKTIYEVFELKNGNDNDQDSVMFYPIFNFIIMEYYRNFIFKMMIINQNDPLFSFSVLANANKKVPDDISLLDKNILLDNQNIDFIIPICTLSSFINDNKGKYQQYSLIFAYFIAKDLNLLHSLDLYCGDLNIDMIGLYYNSETNSLCTSLILYYFLYKISSQSTKQIIINNGSLSNDENIEKYQKKDKKNFIKICNIIGLSNEIINQIEKKLSMNAIVFHLYNKIRLNPPPGFSLTNKMTRFFDNYFSYQVTLPRMKKICIGIQKNGYSINSFYNSFVNSLLAVKTFTENEKERFNYPIKYNISFNGTEIQNKLDIDKIIFDINSNCSLLIEMYEELKKQQPQEVNYDTNQIINVSQNFILENYSKRYMEEHIKQIKNKHTKPVYINLEFIALTKISFNFLLTRIMMNTCPIFKYRIKIIFNAPKSLLRNCERITIQDVQALANITGRLNGIVYENENRNGFYFYLDPLQTVLNHY